MVMVKNLARYLAFIFILIVLGTACTFQDASSLDLKAGYAVASGETAPGVLTAEPSDDLDNSLETPPTAANPDEAVIDTVISEDFPSVPASDIPVSLEPGEWMNLPVIPEVSETARAIYLRGIERGNDPRAFSKIGDCQNVPSLFLSPFDDSRQYSLGKEYAYLEESIDWYAGSFSRESEAVRRGFNAASVISPFWSDPDMCESGENPLNCELRLHRPSVAIISLETWWEGAPENYEMYVREIIETTLSYDVVPILATKADNLEGGHQINSLLADLALEYEIPLWNYWLAVQPLPDHGLLEDEFHLTMAGNYFDDPQRMKKAWPWRNLTALQSLDQVRRMVVETPLE